MGGKLAKILQQARSAVTVNSTAGQEALWRGIPLKLFGDAVYATAKFTSSQEISDFLLPRADLTPKPIICSGAIYWKHHKSQAAFIPEKRGDSSFAWWWI